MSVKKKECGRGEFVLYECCDWTAREEVALLEAIEHFGLGNWEDVSKLIATRSPQEAFNHFEETYVSSNIGDETLSAEQFGTVYDSAINYSEGCDPLKDMIVGRKTSVEREQQQLMAYLPLRDDFELDFDNAAETDIADLSPFGDPGCFDMEMNSLQFELKVAQVHMFRRRITERQRRHDVAHDYSVIPEFFRETKEASSSSSKNSSCSTQKSGDIRGFYREKCKVWNEIISSTETANTTDADKSAALAFLQTICESEANQLFRDLSEERKVRAQLKCLQFFRKRGCRTLEDCGEAMLRESFASAEVDKEVRKQLEHEVSSSSTRSSSVGAGGEHKSCENGHDNLSKEEEQFCDRYEIKPAKYITIKLNLLKKIGDGNSFDDVRARFRDKEGVNKKVADFLHLSGLIPSSS
ncbi:transcriptional adapter 2-beta-like [Symsagittifera roscoffensis]|uniref:transcriptional adapter 2-beta-like n=1 Tax=Symsagittifera roscoffensis TaxID=84072 RepID=UPI00307B4D52